MGNQLRTVSPTVEERGATDTPWAGIKVLSITGMGRSGSTLLGDLLGQIDGWINTGELRGLRMVLVDGFTCGCGAPVSDCKFWAPVLSLVGIDPMNARRPPNSGKPRFRDLPRLLRMEPQDLTGSKVEPYAAEIARTYQAVAEVSGASVLVDTTKQPDHAALLRLLPGIEPFVVHLVRDPRGVVFSRRQIGGGQRPEKRYSSWKTGSQWLERNLVVERIRSRYPKSSWKRLRYEDFVARPSESLRQIIELVGGSSPGLPFLQGHTAHLGVRHTPKGNRNRLRTGTIEITLDDRWKRDQTRLDRLIATGFSAPLLHRYGYTFSGRTKFRDDT